MRGRGGFIGTNVTPASAGINSAASGVWSVREAESLKRAGTWPIPLPQLPTISGLQLHLDAADPAVLFDATSGGSLVAADGSVARWEDKSGNGRHATQSTSGSRPTRKTAIQNSLAVLRFDGDDLLSIANSTATFKFLHNADSTVFLAVKAGVTANPNADYAFIATGTSSGGVPNYALFYVDLPEEGFNPNNQAQMVIGNSPGVVPVQTVDRGVGGFTPNTVKVLSAIAKPTNATAANRVSMRINGGSAVSGNQSTAAVSSADANANVHIGALSGGGSALVGDICEIIIYNSALSDTDRAAVESYLMSKWGLT